MSDPLGTYTFLPWVRQGLGARIDVVDPLGPNTGPPAERASMPIEFDVNGTPVRQIVELIGPGDVLGINPRAVVKTEPRHWITNFEPNYLPYIEFYDEDFPWRYTPATAAGHRLRPWVVLVAVTEEEFREAGVAPPTDERNGVPVPIVEILDPLRVFPPAGQTWAWAHAHAVQDLTNGGANSATAAVAALAAVVRGNPDLASSRLLCARKLRANTAYHALVLPAFEIGRRAGLGQSTTGLDGLAPSWGLGQSQYPVLYRWYFRTADRGDFESLVDLLQPRRVPAEVGIRDMDVQAPGFGVRGMSAPPVMGLEGALRKPGATPRPGAWPPAEAPVLLEDLQAKVNLAAEMLEPPPAGGHPDPIVTLPLYGRWHAKADRLDARGAGWVNELNADPRLRAAAGLGTRVVQTKQDDYMQQAWQQVGDIIEANRRIRQAQLALSAGVQLLRKHVRPLRPPVALGITSPVHARVMGSPETVREQVSRSRVPHAAVEPAFRSLLRARGRVAKATAPAGGALDVLPGLNDGRLTAAEPKAAPAGQIALESIAARVDPVSLPAWLRWLLQRPVLLAALVILGLLLLWMAAGPFAAAALGVGAALGVPAAIRVRRRLAAAAGLRDQAFVPAAVEAAPPRPAFAIAEPGVTVTAASPAPRGTDTTEARLFRRAAIELNERVAVAEPLPPPRVPLDIARTAATVTAALNPAVVMTARTRAAVRVPGTYRSLRPAVTVAPIMAHPSFKEPMYKALRDLSPDFLVPNLHAIPNNTISLMESNARFIESYMVGLNHEMARELLWREYPTDQRGTCFAQFWEVADAVNRDAGATPAQIEAALRDIRPIHEWSATLGSHGNRRLPTGAEPGDTGLVLVIRGELLKKYPTTLVYAQRARWGVDSTSGAALRLLDETNPATNQLTPMFKAEVPPDIHFFGFDLTQSQARGSRSPQEDPGWFLVLQERPGEPRFGMDETEEATPPAVTRWRDLTWNHVGDPQMLHAIDLSVAPAADITPGSTDAAVQWGTHAADMASILFQNPVMVAFHAGDMLD